jgi:hypothetical protein
MASQNDFLCQNAQVRQGTLRVFVIVQTVGSLAFRTVQFVSGFDQACCGRTRPDPYGLCMHAADYDTGPGNLASEKTGRKKISGFCPIKARKTKPMRDLDTGAHPERVRRL